MIEGVVVRELKRHTDDRGWLVELFRSDELDKAPRPAMSYASFTYPGVVRGPHEHRVQTDWFCFLGPSTFSLYLWDNRQRSVTYGERVVIDCPADRAVSVVVPPGVVHAYKNIGTEPGLVFNSPDRLFCGPGRAEEVDEIRHEDDPECAFKID